MEFGCEKPGCDSGVWIFSGHHIIYKSQRENSMAEWFETPENKINLCAPCHTWVHRSRRNMVKVLRELKEKVGFRHQRVLDMLEVKYG